MNPQSHLSNPLPLPRWRRVADLASGVIAFPSRAIAALRSASISMPANRGAVTFRPQRAGRLSRRAPNTPLGDRPGDNQVREEGSLLHASGLDALARILDAHPRRTETSIVPTTPRILSEFEPGPSVPHGHADRLPELPG